jgi:hypothetical protein
MGRIGEVVEYRKITVDGDQAAEVTVDLGAGDVVTVVDNTPSGYQATPLKGDLAIVVELDGAEEYAIVGFIDVAAASAANDGEVVLYARKVTPENEFGDLVGFVNIKNNGELIVGNFSGSITISSSGNVTITNGSNEVTLNNSGCAVNGHLTVAVK